jgi:flagellar assembly factor FliW
LIISTKYFGETEIDDSRIITFPNGLPAFEDIKEYVLLELPGNNLFHCLQSISHPEVAFLLIRPWSFFSDYDIELPKSDLEELGIAKQEQVAIYNIVTIPADAKKMTANLLGPIVINNETLKAKQVILHDSGYSTKHLLFPEREAV